MTRRDRPAPSTRLWHGFAAMGRVDGAEFVVARGEGARVWDVDGREYLDGTAGLWFVNAGHGRAEVAAAAAAQMERLAAHHCFADHANEPALALAERISAVAPVDDGVVFFVNDGSEAVDTAGKIARRYWSLSGRPERQVIVSRRHAYHGMNAYGTSLAGIPANVEGFGALVAGTATVGWDDPAELERLLDELDGTVAAFIGEPVIGAGGVIPPPDGYWPEVARICRERDVLLVADEVICGFGRLGTWFGSQRYGIEPDLITCAKGITSGYVPLGAVVAGRRVWEPFWAEDAPPFRHGYTYSGHPVACAAGMAVLDIYEREALFDRVQALEPVLAGLVEGLLELPLVGEVRAVGLTAAVEFTADAIATRRGLVDEATLASRRHGTITRGLRGVALQLSPPFVTTEDELAAMVEGLRSGILEVAGVRV
jgi:adenosylmethionine-8-amino-7-oxononanoate aminotransferase